MTKPSFKTLKSWLLNISVLIIIYLAVQAYQGRHTPSTGPAPEIDGISMNGENIKLSESPDRPVLVYFWATWCHVCSLTKSAIDNIAQDHPVITIVTQSGTAADIEKYLTQNKFDADIINDESGRLSQAYGVRAFPTIFIIDTKGNINDLEIGLSSEWGLRLRLWVATL